MFDIDIPGLRRKFGNKPKSFLLFELYQNAVDENVTKVSIKLTPVDGRPEAMIVVEDDSPEGFKNLSHAYTLFADSSKLGNPEQRGIWNLGEKLVLAFSKSAIISTTTGTVVFENGVRKVHPRSKRDQGTRFEAVLMMKRADFDECLLAMNRVIPPKGIEVTFNGRRLEAREPVCEFEATLPTTIGDEEGNIKLSKRKTVVRLFEPRHLEQASIYEMGIPVVETGDRWHYDVQQRVPLNMERNNVTPAYLQQLRVEALNRMHEELEEKEASADWARAATSDERCSPKAIGTALDLRYGEKRVAYDPSDTEANARAVAAGYNVVPGGALSAQEWANAKSAGAILPAGRVTPSAKPYSDDPNAEVVDEIPVGDWTLGMANIAEYAQKLHKKLIGEPVQVRIMRFPFGQRTAAAYCKRSKATLEIAGLDLSFGRGSELHFNLMVLGHTFFNEGDRARINALLIHEFAHFHEANHLSDKFFDVCCDLGARLTELALAEPAIFDIKK